MKKRIIRLIMLPALALVLILTSVFAVFPTIHTAQALPGEDESVLDPTFDPSDLDDYQPEYNGPEFDPNDIDASAATESGSGGFGLCQEQSGALSWIVCPVIITVAKATDAIYSIFADTLSVDPIQQSSDSPIYLVWQYMRRLTNIIFIIVLLIVLYSQLTGVGINNYGVKRILPRLIIAVILINLSYIICMFAVDISNIIGNGLYEFLMNIKESVLGSNAGDSGAWIDVVSALTGVTIAGAAGLVVINAVGGLGWLVWVFIPLLFSALGAVVIGFITLAARQALVFLLVMISPLAFVAYLLPNTERFFELWRKTLTSMLVFYPMFSFLLGGSQLAGGAMIAAANGDPLGIVIGLTVEVLPLFASIKLMQMSNTVLGSVSSGLKKLFSPAQAGIANWAGSHAERSRQVHLGTSKSYGARARRELDYRRKLRELDTANALRIREGKALERAYTKLASRDGIAKDGTDKYKKKPNKLTERAALASSYDLSSGQAKSDYENTIKDYSKHFEDKTSQAISARSGQAFLELAKQQYRAANIAQGDQDFLLKNFMGAANKIGENPYDYNRLIKSASGSIRHLGEASIMGQVIAENSRIEQRRRGEARIIANKFGVRKPQFRAMFFDVANISDDGYETDEAGNAVEDINYKLLPNKQHRQWQHYIGVHKDTGKELEKAEYDALSPENKKQYRRVNYMDIINPETGQMVQRVYADDAGYMKELITDDIAIGDPINRRYAFSAGRALTDEEKKTLKELYNVDIPDGYNEKIAERLDTTGLAHRYRTTITTGIQNSHYRDHDVAMTPMLLAQLNNGYIHTPGQFLISAVDSFNKAAKPGPLLINDPHAIQTWARIINSINSKNSGETFEELIENEDIATWLNVNGIPLKGLRHVIDENGHDKWEEVDRTNKYITAEDRKNFFKHNDVPKLAKKLVGSLNRQISAGTLDNQKPGTYEELLKLMGTIKQAAFDNIDPNVAFEDKLNPNINPFETHNPREMMWYIKDIEAELSKRFAIAKGEKYRDDGNEDTPSGNIPHGGDPTGPKGGGSGGRSNNPNDGGNAPSSSGSRSSTSGTTENSSRKYKRPSLQLLNNALDKANQYEEYEAGANDMDSIVYAINGYCDGNTDLDTVCDNLIYYFDSLSTLREHRENISRIIDIYRSGDNPRNRQQILGNIKNYHNEEYERGQIERLRIALTTYITQIFYH